MLSSQPLALLRAATIFEPGSPNHGRPVDPLLHAVEVTEHGRGHGEPVFEPQSDSNRAAAQRKARDRFLLLISSSSRTEATFEKAIYQALHKIVMSGAPIPRDWDDRFIEHLLDRGMAEWQQAVANTPAANPSAGMKEIVRKYLLEYIKSTHLQIKEGRQGGLGGREFPAKKMGLDGQLIELASGRRVLRPERDGAGNPNQLGQGTYATVKTVRDIRTGQELAGKFTTNTLPESRDADPHIRSALKEIVTINDLPRDSTGAIFFPQTRDCAELDDYVVSVTDKLSGKYDALTIADLLDNANELEKDLGYRTLSFQMVLGLWQANTYHCDIKPDNFLYSPAKGMVLPVDFGAATKNPQRRHFLVGTAGYLDPQFMAEFCAADMQQASAMVGSSAEFDLWALGASFYNIATSQRYPQHLTLLENIDERDHEAYLKETAGVNDLAEINDFDAHFLKCRLVPYDRQTRTFWTGFDDHPLPAGNTLEEVGRLLMQRDSARRFGATDPSVPLDIKAVLKAILELPYFKGPLYKPPQFAALIQRLSQLPGAPAI
jgi:serine/threonine protein kinase